MSALNLFVVSSQAGLCKGLPDDVRSTFTNLGSHPTDAQCALQFARTTPGIVTALAGMRTLSHVEENAGVLPYLALPRNSTLA